MSVQVNVGGKKRNFKIAKGGAEWALLDLLKIHKGEQTIDELAPQVMRRGGSYGVTPESLKSAISSLRTKLFHPDNKPAKLSDEKWHSVISSIMPKGFGEGGQGRKAGPQASSDDLADLFEIGDEQ